MTHSPDHHHHIPHNVGTNPTPSTERHAAMQAGGTPSGDATDRVESRPKGLDEGEAVCADDGLAQHAAAPPSALYLFLENNFAAAYSTPSAVEFSKWMDGHRWQLGTAPPVWLTATWSSESPSAHVRVFATAHDAAASVVERGAVLLDPWVTDVAWSEEQASWLEGAYAPYPGETTEADTVTQDPGRPTNEVLHAFYDGQRDLRDALIGKDVAGSAMTLEQQEVLAADYMARVADGRIVDGKRVVSDAEAAACVDWAGDPGYWMRWLWRKPGASEPAYVIAADAEDGLYDDILQSDAIDRIEAKEFGSRWPLNPADPGDVTIASGFGWEPDNPALRTADDADLASENPSE